jgi:hypothetical protein
VSVEQVSPLSHNVRHSINNHTINLDGNVNDKSDPKYSVIGSIKFVKHAKMREKVMGVKQMGSKSASYSSQ